MSTEVHSGQQVIDDIRNAFYAGQSWVSIFSPDAAAVAGMVQRAVQQMNAEYEERNGSAYEHAMPYALVLWDPVKRFTAVNTEQQKGSEPTTRPAFKDWQTTTNSSPGLDQAMATLPHIAPLQEPYLSTSRMFGVLPRVSEFLKFPPRAVIVMATGIEEIIGTNQTMAAWLRFQLAEIINSGIWSCSTSRCMLVCRDVRRSQHMETMEPFRHIIDVPLPSFDDHLRNVRGTVEQPDPVEPDKPRYNIDDKLMSDIAYRLTGMGENLAEVTVAMTVASMDKELRRTQPLTDEVRTTLLTRIERGKASVLRQGQMALTLRSLTDITTLDALCGYDGLLHYVMQRDIPREDLQKLQLPELKGILITGLPGTGKSLAAAAIAKCKGLSLLELNLSLVLAGMVGQSERNLDECLKVIDAQGRCVVLLDEAEKAFSSNVTGSAGDNGVSSRLFGRFLSWLGSNLVRPAGQPIVVMTANRPHQLPAELLRAGRIDRIFGVRPPSLAARIQILKAHFACRNVDPFWSIDDWEVLGRLTERADTPVTGAILEAAVKDAMIAAYQRSKKNASKELTAVPTLAEMQTALRRCMQHDSSQLHSEELVTLQRFLDAHTWSVETIEGQDEQEEGGRIPVAPATLMSRRRNMR